MHNNVNNYIDNSLVWEVPNSQVANSAFDFCDAATFLFKHLNEHNCVSPLLMVSAFSLELFLKSLNSKNLYHQDGDLNELNAWMVTAKPIKLSHSLVSLFDAINCEFRNGIEIAYSSSPLFSGNNLFRDALKEFDMLFESSRYPFENKNIRKEWSITNLINIMSFLGNYVGGLLK